jgi:beta-lactamase regulating signal transducer with metallopeptidase domain
VNTLLYYGLGNALLASLLAVVVAAVGCVCRRRPAVMHSLWLLVLIKLVTPPLVPWPVFHTTSTEAVEGPRNLPVETEAAPAGELLASFAPEANVAPPHDLQPPDPTEPGTEDRVAQADRAEGPPLVEGQIGQLTAMAPPTPQEEQRTAWAMPPWEALVGAVWLTGSVLWLGLAATRLRRFRRLLRLAEPASPLVQLEARRVAACLGLKRCPSLWLMPGPVSPMLWSLAGPARVVLPADLWQRLTAEQRETLLAHELAHWRRRDHWVRHLELAALALYWWHPILWLALREMREAEEQCCDAWVVWALPAAAEEYAAALIETVTFLSESRPAVPLAASGIGRVHHLKRRLTMIMQGTTPRALSSAALIAVLGVGAMLLPLWPTWAQDPPAPARTTPTSPAPDPNPTPAAARYATGLAPAPAAQPAAPAATATYGRTVGHSVSAGHGEDAQDEVDLLKAQLDAKAAELTESKALLQKARRQLDRQERLHAKGASSEGDLEEARTDVTVQEAHVQSKEAQVREVQVRLRQAERRLKAPSGPTAGYSIPAAEAPVNAVPAVTVPPGLAPMPKPTTAPAPAGALVPTTPPAAVEASPYRERKAPEDVERRLRDLEKKLDAILKEVEGLRKLMKQGQTNATPIIPFPPGETVPVPPALEIPEPPKPIDPRSTPTVPLRKS